MHPTRPRLCAALLAAGRPVAEGDLLRLLDVTPEALAAALADLSQALRDADVGVEIEAVAGGYRLVVVPALTPLLAPLLAPAPLPPLSAAALETLALVAYRQPITRGELELARGSTSTSTVETLLERGLIAVIGRKEVVGRPELLATTERFLLEFGLRSLADLPPLSEVPTPLLRG
jgi:segregation and condensation protein B